MNRYNPNRAVIIAVIVGVFVVAAVSFYLALSYAPDGKLKEWRELWIGTAMTTADHQWLANVFPKSAIDAVVPENPTGRSDPDKFTPTTSDSSPTPSPTDAVPTPTNYTGYTDTVLPFREDGEANRLISEEDIQLYNDTENGICIYEIHRGYVGYLALISNPQQVRVLHTRYSEVEGEDAVAHGETLGQFAKSVGGLLAINANAFDDPDGHGTGSVILGSSVSYGNYWQGETETEEQLAAYTSIAFDKNGTLIVGEIEPEEISELNIRDMVQYKPMLICDGKPVISSNAGWGIQPRTVVGQCADGTVALLVIDGRDPLHSLGAQFKDLVDLLLEYGVVNAAACDGGSSSAMWYNGSIISKPCGVDKKNGRRLPNAIVVLPRSKAE